MPPQTMKTDCPAYAGQSVFPVFRHLLCYKMLQKNVTKKLQLVTLFMTQTVSKRLERKTFIADERI